MNLVDKIYELTYLPLLTPYNLIDTIKLENYTNLSIHKNDIGLVSEITCLIDDKTITFYYQFDEKDHLLTLYYYENDSINYLFDRESSIKNLRKEYSNNSYKNKGII